MSRIPYFTDIDFNDLDGIYDITIPFDNREISIDLNFDSESVDQFIIDKISDFLGKLPAYHAFNLQIIEDDYADGDTVSDYLQFHLKHMSEAEINTLIDVNNDAISKEEQLIKSLHLVRIGLYPEQEKGDYFAIFDYSFGKHLTGHVVVISLQEDGSFDHITMES